jgi:hypothetical protein
MNQPQSEQPAETNFATIIFNINKKGLQLTL